MVMRTRKAAPREFSTLQGEPNQTFTIATEYDLAVLGDDLNEVMRGTVTNGRAVEVAQLVDDRRE